jgi:hypothetical protein
MLRVNGMPQVVDVSKLSFEQWGHFVPHEGFATKIIIPEQSVLQVLEELLKRQEPEQEKYFQQMVDDERAARPTVRAQIITLSERRAA